LLLVRSFGPKKTEITPSVILDCLLADYMALQWASFVVYDLEMLFATNSSTYAIMSSRCLTSTCIFIELIPNEVL
jgi:hypothetical protein